MKTIMRTISFDVFHDGDKWIALNEEITVVGKSLDDLDLEIKRKLAERFGRGKVKVTMELDYRRNIPHWIWQYHPYYFYRTIYIDLDKP